MAPLSASTAERSLDRSYQKARTCKTAAKRSSANSLQQQNQKELLEISKSNGNKKLHRSSVSVVEESLQILGTNRNFVGEAKIPSRKFNVVSAIIPKSELNRIKQASKVLTIKDKITEIERFEAERKKREEESEERKREIKEMDKIRKLTSKTIDTTELEHSNEKDRVRILDRAFFAKQEQEEEVKRANQIILAVKCHVIRDAQIVEKNELSRELREEDKRLERMMEQERDKALKSEDEKVVEHKRLNEMHAQEIKDQLKKRAQMRESEARQIEVEAQIRAQAKSSIERDEEEKLQKKRDRTAKIRADLQKVAELSALVKKVEFEKQRNAEMKVQEYMRLKEERETKLALERKLAKEALERKQERLVASQQRAIQTLEQHMEMAVRREREEKEREFRRKEKEAALRRKRLEKELVDARLAQIEETKKRRAEQNAREEIDFRHFCDRLKEEDAKERDLNEKRYLNRVNYRTEITKQMVQKEKERHRTEEKAKIEFLNLLEKEKNREKNIKTIIKMKIDSMRKANMPEKFIKDVEKQLLNVSDSTL